MFCSFFPPDTFITGWNYVTHLDTKWLKGNGHVTIWHISTNQVYTKNIQSKILEGSMDVAIFRPRLYRSPIKKTQEELYIKYRKMPKKKKYGFLKIKL